MTDQERLKQIVEAALLAAGRPLNLDQLQQLFPDDEEPEKKRLRAVLTELTADYQGRGIEITEVGNGFRIQVRAELSPWISKLWAERPPKYSRALLETLALIAYRQPITRGEIEDVRGVSVSTNIIKTLTEREWVRVVGHRDVPGKPALYATTKEFLDYFNLKSLNDLPTLAEIRDLESINRELELVDPDKRQEGESDLHPEATAVDTAVHEEGLESVEDEDTIPLVDQRSDGDETAEGHAPANTGENLSEEQPIDPAAEDQPSSKPAAHESE
ncbi:MAG: SMC-Scp complex subunit ScpB [gamma proteobacterium symbiont of Ctena orbiculata]|nr:SMC-Scp complex subunit ScpB [Candidatus Thiodiazotropha taylori]PUB89722.1 MAG: SMC-Scp complex subunit ScpB [gamma proteobacterium symbiont of Ctena orbiculata]MBT2997825.1 SMC-Scp complex subunit ScpB [Candidatus Thiodiazotropha taylori]MBT3000406.1 SMC-Scp complex subunit ScpB [Candidatus Thiodiazotropha taylori]MBT3027410.1 SMC-Scp complex subunit ScpB [Candidatus Thiodiazotropha taylori]